MTFVLVTGTGATPPKAKIPRLGSNVESDSCLKVPRFKATENTTQSRKPICSGTGALTYALTWGLHSLFLNGAEEKRIVWSGIVPPVKTRVGSVVHSGEIGICKPNQTAVHPVPFPSRRIDKPDFLTFHGQSPNSDSVESDGSSQELPICIRYVEVLVRECLKRLRCFRIKSAGSEEASR